MAANKWEIPLGPTDFIMDATAHPDMGVAQNRMYLLFNDSTVETCYSVQKRLPDAYAAGTVTAVIQYFMASGTTGKVDFEISVEAVSDGDALDLDTSSSFDTLNAANATVPATQGYIDFLTITLTNKDSMAAGDMIRIKLERDADDATDDTATGDCAVLSVTLYEA